MSMENVIKFYSEVEKNDQLKAKFANLKIKELDEKIFNEKILSEAKKMGYDFTYQEASQVLNDVPKELDDETLENVTGGDGDTNITISDICSHWNLGQFWDTIKEKVKDIKDIKK